MTLNAELLNAINQPEQEETCLFSRPLWMDFSLNGVFHFNKNKNLQRKSDLYKLTALRDALMCFFSLVAELVSEN